jgi:hypothetical protein
MTTFNNEVPMCCLCKEKKAHSVYLGGINPSRCGTFFHNFKSLKAQQLAAYICRKCAKTCERIKQMYEGTESDTSHYVNTRELYLLVPVSSPDYEFKSFINAKREKLSPLSQMLSQELVKIIFTFLENGKMSYPVTHVRSQKYEPLPFYRWIETKTDKCSFSQSVMTKELSSKLMSCHSSLLEAWKKVSILVKLKQTHLVPGSIRHTKKTMAVSSRLSTEIRHKKFRRGLQGR